ncbi:hypothetical protein [Mycetocola saprophilus]|uniref:hypothetical protein n=1 Tax=Mycetocola saprophilus TaxID=76636 RepID=UPI003BF0394B
MALLPSRLSETLAAWTDSESVGGTATAYTYPPVPGTISCVTGFVLLIGNNATLSWTAPAGLPAGSGYQLTVESKDGTSTMAIPATTFTFQKGLLDGLLGILITSSGPVKVTIRSAQLIDIGGGKYQAGWVSQETNPPSITINYTGALLGLLGGFTCPT